MSAKASEAIDAISVTYNKIHEWMLDKDELGEDTTEYDKWGNSMDDVMVDWLETLSEIHSRMSYYATKWGDI